MRRTTLWAASATAIAVLISAAAQIESPRAPVPIGATASATEAEEFTRLLDESATVLASQKWIENLNSLQRDYPHVLIRSDITANTDAVIRAVMTTTARYRYVPVVAGLIGSSFNDTALTGWTGRIENGQSLGSMTIGRIHLGRWNSRDVVEQSCAVNTIAHELSHTLSQDANVYNLVFEDTGVTAPPEGTPVASYLIGSVAQCTWLQSKGRVPEDGLKACVEVFGIQAFNSNRCKSFGEGQPVAFREDLPAPAVYNPRAQVG